MKQFKDIYNKENYTKDINNDYKLTNKERKWKIWYLSIMQ